jgi:hypothetical protein
VFPIEPNSNGVALFTDDFLERQAAIAALKNHHSNTIPTN